MNEAKDIKDAWKVLEARLPPGWKSRFKLAPSGPAKGADAILSITGPDGAEAQLVVEVKNRLFPRIVEDVRFRLARYSSDPGLVVTGFLTRSTRERLKESDLNYLDLTGNLRLKLSRPGLFLETEGADTDPSPSEEPRRSLKGPKAGRIVRALCDIATPLSISDLAIKAKVNVGYASRLVEWMAREALLNRRIRGPVETVDRPALIRRWSENYSVLTSNEATAYLEPRGLDNLIRALAANSFPVQYVVTGSVAASRMAPTAPAKLAMIYVDDVEEAAAEFKIRSTETGANVMLLAPFDDVVYQRTRTVNGLTIAAPSQVAVDLLTSPGRAPSEAEAILEALK